MAAPATKSRLTRGEAKALTRRRLLDAARAVFLRDGYHGTTVDRVAEEAGFSKGAVYSTFQSKADMFLALYEERHEQRGAAYARIFAAGNYADSTRSSALDWSEVLRGERDWLIVLIEFWAHAARDETLRRRFAELHGRTRKTIAQLAAEAARTSGHEIADPELVAMAHMALGNGFALEGLVEPEVAASDAYQRADLALSRGLESGVSPAEKRKGMKQ